MDYSDLYFDYYSLEPAVRQAEMERQGARLQEAWMLCAFPAVRDTKPPASRSLNVGLGQGPAFRVFRETKWRASWSLDSYVLYREDQEGDEAGKSYNLALHQGMGDQN